MAGTFNDMDIMDESFSDSFMTDDIDPESLCRGFIEGQ